ncbi:hypothetical protein M378DRAFT_288876 [Amanita muscaria Koide BX008]|uniref:Uncharacterized protein n=1 Tax=Amanita muscaria (strain Koide BX008) TaxID=946122 RepID=A0A0C2WC45_AMAMK|nr:hypothetical protein M378DRAFT_288876 [Amanita muscaria Koide BX008]
MKRSRFPHNIVFIYYRCRGVTYNFGSRASCGFKWRGVTYCMAVHSHAHGNVATYNEPRRSLGDSHVGLTALDFNVDRGTPHDCG